MPPLAYVSTAMPGQASESSITECNQMPRLEAVGTSLAHLPDYGLIICKTCKFAIQPKALSSHLLRHHIYRDKRQKLLDRIADLNLVEPGQVPLPTARPPAFPYLPVAPGYRCKFAQCSHLCISHKRMSHHLHEHHGRVDAIDVGYDTERAYLQTFFKGNKVRYFEVKPRDGKVPHESPQGPAQLQFLEPFQRPETNVSPTLLVTYSGSQAIHKAPGTPLPMEYLMYLHHYTTVTGLSLSRGGEPAMWWTHDLPLQCSAQPFVMHGMLGAAAFHQALLALDLGERRRHQSAGLLHQSIGLATFRSIVDHPTRETSTALTAFSRMLGVQSLVQALLEGDHASSQIDDLENSRTAKILEFLLLLRGGLEILLSMQNLLPAGSGFILSAEVLDGLEDLEYLPGAGLAAAPCLANHMCTRFVSSEGHEMSDGWAFRSRNLLEVRQLMKLCGSVSEVPNASTTTNDWMNGISELDLPPDDVQHLITALAETYCAAESEYCQSRLNHRTALGPVLSCYPYIPIAIYRKLVSLPSRLTSNVSKPQIPEIKAFDQAMAALVSCFSRSYAMDAVWARWNGIESWPRMLSDYFFDMIKVANPIALVLVAHWCVLLSMQEDHYWFLRGQSQRIMKVVLDNLDVGMQSFVQESVSSLS